MTLLNGIELSPCIVSQARFALRLKKIPASNSKQCSFVYWMKVVNHLSKLYNIDPDIRDSALRDWIKH